MQRNRSNTHSKETLYAPLCVAAFGTLLARRAPGAGWPQVWQPALCMDQHLAHNRSICSTWHARARIEVAANHPPRRCTLERGA